MADVVDAAVVQPNLSLVLERITDGFFALDAQWRIAYMNAEARKMLGGPDDVIGRFWLDAFPRARGRLFEREYTRAMREQKPVQFVEYSKTAHCWFEVKAYPSPDGISVYFRDVSTRIEAQREVERNAQRLQALVEFGRTALSGGGCERTVAASLELIGESLDTPVIEVYDYDPARDCFTIRDATGWTSSAIFAPGAAPHAHLYHAIRTREPFVSSDLRIDPRARSLGALPAAGVLSCIAATVENVDRIAGVVACYDLRPRTFSVSEVRFMESVAQTLAESNAAYESNRRTEQVLESIGDAFVALDRDLRITYVNERMAEFWNESRERIVGRFVSEFTREFDRDGMVLAQFKDSLANERAATYEVMMRERYYEGRVYPFSGGVAVYVRDITRRKRDDARVRELNAQLEARVLERTKQLEIANKELESFSYSVSHDLRAPLRAIDGFSQALAEDYADGLDDGARSYIGRVRKAAQRMADLIDALLKLSRVARTPIVFVPVDLGAIANSVFTELHEREPERSVETIVAPGLNAHGDPQLLRAVFDNLLGNAWKFTRKASDARIEVGSTDDGAFFVRDNGAGFDMTYGNKLFGAFQRLHHAEDYEGTGIGLATVARIVHRHGGTIRAEGAVGAGATFTFTLPRARTQTGFLA